ncbi:hypothetical protein QR98_0102140 [Sarcoptes scabiei]|uniref:Uncharacterized protein n=1 Tax=Sarcoptes scabiei TaxID=52283 RepID=A0A132AKZ8_SARSC|nr:hypothetical protein QR98_0102140 [Sarcoptes scabiei]
MISIILMEVGIFTVRAAFLLLIGTFVSVFFVVTAFFANHCIFAIGSFVVEQEAFLALANQYLMLCSASLKINEDIVVHLIIDYLVDLRRDSEN